MSSFRGDRVPCFEKPARADYVETRLTERGHALRAPDQDSSLALAGYMRRATCNSSRRPGRSGWRSTWPTPMSSPFRRSGLCAPCAAISNPTISSPASGCIPWTTAHPWLPAPGRLPRAAPMPLPAPQCVSPVVPVRRSAVRARRATMRGRTSWGYCFLNNAAVAAQTLRNQGAARVAVLDVDYHHGNGTQSIFMTAPMCCSSASMATRAPNTRSTWAMPMKPVKAPGLVSISTFPGGGELCRGLV